MNIQKASCLLLLAPFIAGVTSPDSAYTDVSFGLGGGQYAIHDCSGARRASFVDGGATVTHKFESPWRLGATFWLINSKKTTAFVYPDLAFDADFVSVGTTGLRLGPKDVFYGELAFGDEVPPLSGKGLVRIGLGGYVPDLKTHLWLGKNALPYENSGWAAQADFEFSRDRFVFVNGRYGTAHNIPEYGLSIGLRLRSR